MRTRACDDESARRTHMQTPITKRSYRCVCVGASLCSLGTKETMNGAVLSLTIANILAFPAVFAAVAHFPAQNGETLRSVLLTDGSLVLGSNTTLRRLSSADLSVLQEISLTEGQVSRLLAGDPGGTYSGRVLSCLRTTCSLLDETNIASQNWEDSNVLLVDADSNAEGIFVPGESGQSVLTIALQRSGEQVSRVVRGNLVNVGASNGQDFSIIARQAEGFLYDREFLTSFENNGFTYFITKQGPGETRLVRVCNNDTSSSTASGAFVSYFEIRLECGGPDSVPTAAAFLPSDQSITLSFSGGEQNLVCVFQLSTIHSRMTQKYDDCRHGMGNSGLARSGITMCDEFDEARLNNPEITECNLVSTLLPSQEVEAPLSASPVLSLPLSDGQFTSLIHSTLDSARFLFAGTNNGKYFQYHYGNRSSINPIRTIYLAPSGETSGTLVTRLAVSADGLTLFALSPSKLFSVAVDVCDTYTSCASCLGEGRDPICGWCSLENRCSRQSRCTDVWVSDSMGSCPAITSAQPSIIYVREIQMSDIDIQLATANVPVAPGYQCWLNFMTSSQHQQSTSSSVTMEMPATRNNDMFTCRVRYDDLPAIPINKDSLLSLLSLRHDNNDVAVLNEPIRFSNCSVHTNCTSCIDSESQCNWCPFTFKCIASRNDSCPGVDETAAMESCPKLLPPENNDNYIIHTSYSYGENPLVIRAENLDQFRDNFSNGRFNCVIKNGAEVLFGTEAVLTADNNVECRRNRFDYTYSDGMESLEAGLAVEWIDNNISIDNPNRTGVTLYSCSRRGSNCARCLSIPPAYNCGFCSSQFSCLLNDQCGGPTDEIVTRVEKCSLPTIQSVSPSSGPVEGGTLVTVTGKDLATTRDQIRDVTIGGAKCVIKDDSYDPGVQFQCVTGESEQGRGSYGVVLDFRYLLMTIEDSSFTYEVPVLGEVSPVRGPQSGGTMVTITGNHLDIGTTLSVTLHGQTCYLETKTLDEVTCLSGRSDDTGEGVVTVTIDNWSSNVPRATWEYAADPSVTNISPNFSFVAGGTEYVVQGMNFDLIREPRLLIHITVAGSNQSERRRRRQTPEIIKSQPCTTDSGGTRMMCLAPPIDPALLSPGRQLSATLGLALDEVASLRRLDNYTVTIHPNPSFQNFGKHSFPSTDNIHLTVESQGGKFEFTEDMIEVLITPCSRGECVCGDVNFQPGNTSLTCLVETASGLRRTSELTVTVHVGRYNQTVGTIEINGPINPVIIIVPIVVVFFVIVIVIVVILLVVCYRGQQKDSRYKELIMEMEKLESTVARECKLGFAELQTDLDELTGDVSGHRLPYRDLKVYLLSVLFPGSKDHAVLHPVQLPLQRQISSQKAIRDFHDLCMDKKVLLLFIRTLEEQRGFSIRDKSLVGSLLMVALHNRLDYATEILKMLLHDLITKSINKSPKLLLRRTESVAEKMLTNWLAFCLHGYIVEQAGKPLYLMYRAVKSQLEKGPIDVITGEARYSLSDHKLIRQKMDVEVLSVTVEADDGLRVPVRVLSCDTISQVKEKLLDAIYKATPVSHRPSLTAIDLELIKSPRDYCILRDEDTTTAMDGGWKQLNTLQHYGVEEGAAFRLMKRNGHAPPGRPYDYPASLISSHAVRNRALSEAEDGTRVWHLFKQHDTEDPKRSPFMNKKMITEVYLPRMLSTKNILQKFVSDLFSSLFGVSLSPTSPITYSNFFPTSPGSQPPLSYAPGSTVPMAVKYLLDFLDDSAEAAQITERDVVHTWKNNALALRFWVNMMKNPEFVFDVNKSHTVDACLSVIAGAFIDGCSYADVKLTIDSPTSKLLYNKEVRDFKVKVRQYYQSVARLTRIPEDAMQSYLKQLSEHQAQVFRKNGGFVVESALYELLRYANKYSDQMLTNLRNAGLDARAQVFESVVRATT